MSRTKWSLGKKRWRGLRAATAAVSIAVLAGLVPPSVAAAQEPAPDPALDWDNYEKVRLAEGLQGQPIDLAVLPDGRVLHTAKAGELRLTDPAQGTTQVANTLDVYSTGETGLLTVTLDPDFESNQWVYLYYAPTEMDGPYPPTTPSGNMPATLPEGETEAFWDRWKGYDQLSRFKWDEATDSLDLSSEQVIIKIETNRGGHAHHSGDVAFDAAGNLYLSTGDNTGHNAGGTNGYAPLNDLPNQNPASDVRRSSGNTNDLRGKILRITVQPDGSYTIPEGNLFPVGEYPADKTRPEIYIMGLRNPYRIDIDQQTNTLIFGDYGPDAGAANPERGPMGYVEWNTVAIEGGAHNSGWPYCHGPQTQPYNDWNFATNTPGENFDCDNLKNTSRHNTGLVDLPPAKPAKVWYGDRNCRTLAPEDCDNPLWPELTSFSENIEQAPMAGPIYRYDADNPSETKFPEYWDGKAFLGEYSQDYIAALTFDAPEGDVTKIENFLSNEELGARGYPLWDGIMDLEFGPDGALYVIQLLGGNIDRVDYTTGNRRPRPSIQAEPTSGGTAPLTVAFDAGASTDPDGDALTFEWDFDGDGTWDATGVTATHTYVENGQYNARLNATDVHGKSSVTSVAITVGNTAPEVKIVGLPDGGFIDWGQAAIYELEVIDPEETAEPTCRNGRYTMSLGHASHAHPFTSGMGVKIGVPTYPNAPGVHGATEDLYSVLDVSYTDNGANGVAPATGRDQVLLNPKRLEAEYAEDSSGTETIEDSAASAGRAVSSLGTGNWLAFKPVSLLNIEGVDALASGAGTLALRWDDPTAEPFQTIEVPAGEGYRSISATLEGLADLPVDSGILYVTGESGDVVLDALTFVGDGVGDVTPPTVTGRWNPAAPTGDDGWYITAPTLTLTPEDNGSIYARHHSLDGGESWQQISYADQYGSCRELGNTQVITKPGEHEVFFRVTDTSQLMSEPGSLPVKIDLTAPSIILEGLEDGQATAPITIRAEDFEPGSGGAQITSVTLDGEPAPLDELGADLLTAGEHSITVRARDIAGNVATRTETFSVADVTAPEVTAALTPASPTGNNSWYLEPVTLTITATDDGTVASREYSLDGGATWLETGTDGTAVISQEGATTVRYRATDAAGNVSAVGTIAVNIDTRLTEVSFPQAVDGRVGNSVRLVPTLTDPLPGSGNLDREGLWDSVVLAVTLDGKDIPIRPIDLSQLSLGRHTVTYTVNDPAGNAGVTTFVFDVVTSFDDLGALIDRYEDAGDLTSAQATELQGSLSAAEAAAEAGQVSSALKHLKQFERHAVRVRDRDVRDVLRRDVAALGRIVENGYPSNEGTGVTTERVETPRALPEVTPQRAPHNPDADFDVLVVSRTAGFRHNHIPDSVVAIQEMGAEHGFNVDVFDPQLPFATLPVNPLLSAALLSEYETVVFNSTIGNTNFSAAEQAVFEDYIRSGGNFVGIHGATDCCRGNAGQGIPAWTWYHELVGAVFNGHAQGAMGGNPPCESCVAGAVVVTEDATHPATQHFPTRWSVHDELYNFVDNPRENVHVLQTLDESTYRDHLNVIKEGRWARGYNSMMGDDHPISWCQNYEGARSFTQVIGHNRELWYDQTFLDNIVNGILWSAGEIEANCVSYREVDTLIDSLESDGMIDGPTADMLQGALAEARAAYVAGDPRGAGRALRDLNRLSRTEIRDRSVEAQLTEKVRELSDWMKVLQRNGDGS